MKEMLILYSVLLGEMFRRVALNFLPSCPRKFYNISVPLWRIVNYFFVDLECPGNDQEAMRLMMMYCRCCCCMFLIVYL